MQIPIITDGATVLLDGRPYTVRVEPANCGSLGHYHYEPHADGAAPMRERPGRDPGPDRHHHHDPAYCDNLPRQVTLTPAWEAPPRHVHSYGDGGECSCGAWREAVTVPLPKGEGPPMQAGSTLYRYHNPPGGDHPNGWSYYRREPHQEENGS